MTNDLHSKHKLGSNILALDLGTKTGWVLSMCTTSGELVFIWGNEDFSTKRFVGGGMRLLRFQEWLDQICKIDTSVRTKIDEVYFEEVVFHSGIAPAHVYGGFLAVLTMWCEKNSIPYQGVPVKTIKKYITGNGNANKKMVIDAVKGKGYNTENDNEADALALALYVRKM